ncbi:MAG: DoxX family protein [Gemmatimonadota bacterium]
MSAATIPSPAFGTARHLAPSPGALWGGRVLLAVGVLFLLFDITVKLMVSPEAVAGTTALGYAAHHLPVLAALEVVCLVLYLIPRTAPIGAVLWTGYLGGAIATHLRIDNPLFSHILFPVYVAAILWGALYLRDARVRALIASPR